MINCLHKIYVIIIQKWGWGGVGEREGEEMTALNSNTHLYTHTILPFFFSIVYPHIS